MLIERAEIAGRAPLALRIAGERIAEIGPALEPRRGEERLDAAGGALLPGLHDHHLHLLALAAAEGSVRCGPPWVRTRDDLERGAARGRVRARAGSAGSATTTRLRARSAAATSMRSHRGSRSASSTAAARSGS